MNNDADKVYNIWDWITKIKYKQSAQWETNLAHSTIQKVQHS